MVFDPTRLADGTSVEGHLDAEPIYEVLLTIHRTQVTGRLTVDDATGPNHMYFMQGRPVGVALAEYIHPLGQLLLELGRVNGATFVRAQRLIAEGNRLAGQVFKEIGVLDDQSLRDLLAVQARKKAEHLCRLGSRPYTFHSGLIYLMGFTATPLDIWVVVFLGVRAQLGPEARAALIDGLKDHQVRIVNAPGDATGLPAPLSGFGFGAAEERFLQRIVGGWEKVSELCETGTLPLDEAAVLLRFLDVLGRLERRKTPAAVPVIPPPQTPRRPTDRPKQLDDVSSWADRGSRQAERAPVSPPGMFAGPLERTDPRQAVIPDARSVPSSVRPAERTPIAPAADTDTRGRLRGVVLPEPIQAAPPPSAAVFDDDIPAPVVKPKKKVRRTEPLPSEGSGILVSETRKEKTHVGPMPSIVIEDDQ